MLGPFACAPATVMLGVVFGVLAEFSRIARADSRP